MVRPLIESVLGEQLPLFTDSSFFLPPCKLVCTEFVSMCYTLECIFVIY